MISSTVQDKEHTVVRVIQVDDSPPAVVLDGVYDGLVVVRSHADGVV